MENSLRDEFLLDPDITFLNHGSFGACPRSVFQTCQAWQLRLERQPVQFLGREINDLIRAAITLVAQFLNVPATDVVFVPNATAGVNIVARSLCRAGVFQPGDEVLTSDHEYGACMYAWEAELGKIGATLVRRPVSLPLTHVDNFVEQFLSGITPRTRAIYLSHVTSPTALTFPADLICAAVKARGIVTIVDGAHAPKLVDFTLDQWCDFYTGNLHKWACAPKGAAFLHVLPKWQSIVEPLYTSWGSYPGASFPDRMHMQGTRDPAAWLTVPDALAFMHRSESLAARSQAMVLANRARERLHALTKQPPIAPDGAGWFTQMFAVRLPECDELALKTRLYDEYRVEVPVYRWNGDPYLRVSVAIYNTEEDIERLLFALEKLLPEVLIRA